MANKSHTLVRPFFYCLLVFAFAAPASAALIGPSPYLSFADSPFDGGSFSYFYLEDFEDHLFNTPGVTASAGGVTSVVFGPSVHDSVDADDGLIDGSGLDGDSFFSGSGATGITFVFDKDILGALPTSVGIVWTDGAGLTTFEAFNALNISLGGIVVGIADGSHNGETGEDNFFGATNNGGISKIFISNSSGGIEVDHLQYGLNGDGLSEVPVPAAVWLFGTALIGLIGFSRRKISV